MSCRRRFLRTILMWHARGARAPAICQPQRQIRTIPASQAADWPPPLDEGEPMPTITIVDGVKI